MSHRVILHIDMDAFFAAVEQLDNPGYRGKPVIVGADPKGGKGRGVVSTASYEARKYGIHSAMPISKAYKLCPEGIYIRPRMKRYEEISKRIMEILYEFSPVIEQVSIDEAFLDCTGTEKLFGSPISLAKKIKKRIHEETGLTASIGIACNKSIAKILSDLSKPDGLLYCEPGKEREFLAPLEIKHLWGVGEKTFKTLNKMGFRKIGDIASSDKEELKRVFGKNGERIWYLANGIDNRQVETYHIRKSIGKETTFQRDVSDIEVIEKTLFYLIDVLTFEMSEKGVKGKTVTLKIRFDDFTTFTRRKTLIEHTDDSVIIREVALQKLKEMLKIRKKVRLIGISLSNLLFINSTYSSDEIRQNELFPGEGSKSYEVQKLLQSLKKQYGDVVKRAIFINDRKNGM